MMKACDDVVPSGPIRECKSLVVIPEGYAKDQDAWSGIAYYLGRSLDTVSSSRSVAVSTLSFGEALELEEMLTLHHSLTHRSQQLANHENRLLPKLALPLNAAFCSRLIQTRDAESLFRAFLWYWDNVAQEAISRWPVGVPFDSPTLAFSPFYPYTGPLPSHFFYTDCVHTDFFLDRNHGTLGHLPIDDGLAHALRAVEQHVLNRAKRVFTFSERAKRDISVGSCLGGERLTVVGAGANLAQLPDVRDAINRRLESSGRALQVLFVGRDFDRKGGGVVLDVAKLLPTSRFSFKLVTDVPEHYMAAQLRPSNVQILKPVGKPAVLRLLEQADAFIFPTRHEPYGIVLLEAMLYALPIVATNVGAIPEILGRTQPDLLCEIDDSSEMAALLSHLEQVRCAGVTIGTANHDRAAAVHTWDVVASKLLDGMFPTRRFNYA